MRALVAVLAFLLVLILLGFAPASFDRWLVALFWGAVLAGSIVIVYRSIRRAQTTITGQLAALPRSWQRWILDERDPAGRQDP